MNQLKYILVIILSVWMQYGYGQVHQEFLNRSTNKNFYEITQQVEQYFEGKNKGKGSGYKQFKRWEYFWRDRVLPDGSFPDMQEQLEMRWSKAQAKSSNKRASSKTWESIGYTSIIENGKRNQHWGMGRTDCIAFHPTNPAIFYVASLGGGLWKTSDGGQTYHSLTDDLPYVGVGSVVVDYQNPSNIYIFNNRRGILKSTDGGESWIHVLPANKTGNVIRMSMNADNPSILMFSSNRGLFRTTDAGVTWEHVQTGNFKILKYHPTRGNIVYATRIDQGPGDKLYRSVDAGKNWEQVNYGDESIGFVNFAMTPANPDMVVVVSEESGPDTNPSCHRNYYYVSYQNGDDGTFEKRESVVHGDRGPLCISPTNENYFYTGWFNVRRTPDAGRTWYPVDYVPCTPPDGSRDPFLMSHWWNSSVAVKPENIIHTDQQYMAYHPITKKIFVCNDGGVFAFDENTETWEDLSDGLIITELYDMATAQDDPTVLVTGSQDNGGARRNADGVWWKTQGGDNTSVAIDPTDHTIFYTLMNWGGGVRYMQGKSTPITGNIVAAFGDANHGGWVTPITIDPSDTKTIYTARKVLYRSNNQGDLWKPVSENMGGEHEFFRIIKVAPSTSQVIYAATPTRLFYSSDYAKSWSLIAHPIKDRINSLTVHPDDPNRLWITASGFRNDARVFESKDAGKTWTDMSDGLPVSPVGASVYDKDKRILYVGTDMGVYYWVIGEMTQWRELGTGLPFTSIMAIDIQYSSQKLRVGTYGRGVWETDLLELDDIDLCSENLILTDTLEGQQNIERYTIISSSTLAPQANVNFTAANQIQLNQGFKALGSLSFKAQIDNGICLSKGNNGSTTKGEVSIQYKGRLVENSEYIEKDTQEDITLDVYPNPTSSDFYVWYDQQIEGKVVIKLYNLSGKTVLVKHSLKVQNENTNQSERIDLQGVPAGMYIIEMTNDKRVLRSKLLITE